MRVDHQADGDKEDGTEQIAYRLDQPFDLQQLTRLGHDRANQECTQHHAVLKLDHQQAETEAQTQHGNQQHLVAFEFRHVSQQPGHQQDADDQRDDHEQRQLAHRGKHFAGADRAADRNPRQQGDDADAEDVLDDQHAEDELGKTLVLHLQVIERLDDDGGRGDRQDGAQEQRVHGVPVEPAANLETDPDHQDDFQEGRDKGRGADLEQLAQAEFQPQAEHQEDDAQLCQGLDGVFIVDQAERRRVRTDNEACNDVAQHDGLLEPMKENRDHPGNQHDHCQILDEADGMHGAILL
ncbi:hypothetical protein D3C79_403940 [compost metagenome]